MSEDRSIFELVTEPSHEIVRYGNDRDQIIELFRTGESADFAKEKVLLVHGGYWRPEYDRSHLRPYAIKLAERGLQVYLLEYRRNPGQPRQYLADLIAALDLLGGCTVVGHSAGGQLALLAANHPSTLRVVALAPVSDLEAAQRLDLDNGAVVHYLGQGAVNYPDLNPIAMAEFRAPIRVIHGARDQRVPVELSRALAQQFPEIEYHEIEEFGHFELIDPRIDPLIDLVVLT